MINKLLEEIGTGSSKSVESPIDEKSLPNSAASEPLGDDEHMMYRCTWSVLKMAIQLRPNLLEVISMQASYLHTLLKTHIVAAERALRFLNDTQNRKLNLKRRANN